MDCDGRNKKKETRQGIKAEVNRWAFNVTFAPFEWVTGPNLNKSKHTMNSIHYRHKIVRRFFRLIVLHIIIQCTVGSSEASTIVEENLHSYLKIRKYYL